MILNGAKSRKICRNGYGKNGPPYSLLIPYVVAKPFEEDQKRELDSPKARIEKDNHSNGSSEVPCRPLWKVRWRWEYLTRRNPEVEIKIAFTHLPNYSVNQEY